MNRRSMASCHVSLDYQTPQDERCVIYTFGPHRRSTFFPYRIGIRISFHRSACITDAISILSANKSCAAPPAPNVQKSSATPLPAIRSIAPPAQHSRQRIASAHRAPGVGRQLLRAIVSAYKFQSFSKAAIKLSPDKDNLYILHAISFFTLLNRPQAKKKSPLKTYV